MTSPNVGRADHVVLPLSNAAPTTKRRKVLWDVPIEADGHLGSVLLVREREGFRLVRSLRSVVRRTVLLRLRRSTVLRLHVPLVDDSVLRPVLVQLVLALGLETSDSAQPAGLVPGVGSSGR